MSETTYYSQGEAQVTSASAVLGGTTYAIADIRSVSIGTKARSRLAIPLLCLAAYLALLVVLGSYVSSQILYPVGAVLGLGLAVVLVFRGPRTTTYTVRLRSASGETDAFGSKNRQDIEKIVDAIHQAIIARQSLPEPDTAQADVSRSAPSPP